MYSGTLNRVVSHGGTSVTSFPASASLYTIRSNLHVGTSTLMDAFQLNEVGNRAKDYLAIFNFGGRNPKMAGFNSAAAAYQRSSFFASRLAAGAKIGSQHLLSAYHGLLAAGSNHAPFGWAGTGTVGFLAFEFTLGTTPEYGWIQIKNLGNVNGRGGNSPYVNDLELIDYAYSDDPNFATGQTAPPTAWTGGAGTTNWADSGNWSGPVPGSISSTVHADATTAMFNQSAAGFSPLTIDTNRNLLNITFDNSGGLLTSSLTIGTTTGNALLLIGGGTVQTTASVANPQTVNAPLVLEGTNSAYTFSSNATLSSATLNFGGSITAGASSGTTTLTLSGTNSGTNTLSGSIGNGGSGATIALAVQGGNWVLSAANTYSGGTTVTAGTLNTAGGGTLGTGPVAISAGATLELAGSVSALNQLINVSNSGSLVVAASVTQTVGTVKGGTAASPQGSTTVNAAASLTTYQIIQNSLTIGAGGMVTLVPSGSGTNSTPALPNNTNYSSTLNSLSIAGTTNAWTGTLDIGNNGLVIEYGSGSDPFATITNMVHSGYANGNWTGTGITSSLARAAVLLGSPTPALNIGLIDFVPNGPGFGSSISFEGQTITTSAVLVRMTYMDDLVLSGDMAQANATSDALFFAANYGSGTTWHVGDITHDNVIDTNDALLFAANYVVGLPSLDGATGNAAAMGGPAPVPEPATVALLAFGAAGVLAMRRSRENAHGADLD